MFTSFVDSKILSQYSVDNDFHTTDDGISGILYFDARICELLNAVAIQTNHVSTASRVTPAIETQLDFLSTLNSLKNSKIESSLSLNSDYEVEPPHELNSLAGEYSNNQQHPTSSPPYSGVWPEFDAELLEGPVSTTLNTRKVLTDIDIDDEVNDQLSASPWRKYKQQRVTKRIEVSLFDVFLKSP